MYNVDKEEGQAMKIYKVTNNINGMIYIGKTKRDIAKRWKQHCIDAKKPLMRFKLQEAILEYGADNFTIECIDEAQTDQEACEKEIFWIEHYQCIFPKGYNVSKGGNNGGNYVRIKNETTGEVFESITEAARKYNKAIQAINQALDKPHRTSAGCKWVTLK